MLNNRIKELREKRKLTLKGLASEFNRFAESDRDNIKPISYATLSRWEKGVNDPPYKAMEKLADYFGVSVSYLQGITNEVDEAIFNKAISEIKKILRTTKLEAKDMERLLKNLDLIIANSPVLNLKPSPKNTDTIASNVMTLDDWYSNIKDAE